MDPSEALPKMVALLSEPFRLHDLVQSFHLDRHDASHLLMGLVVKKLAFCTQGDNGIRVWALTPRADPWRIAEVLLAIDVRNRLA